MRDTTAEFEAWLKAGGRRVGQVLVSAESGGWELRNEADAGREDLETFSNWVEARGIANVDDNGDYRPLKTAPTLRRGWRLVLPDAHSVRLAIDHLYPAMIGLWVAQRHGELAAVDLRETLGRQTGMYRITQKLTDEQAQRLIARQCRSNGGCLKTILWRIGAGVTVPLLPADKFRVDATPPDSLPLLCHEACNILIAGARKLVKEETHQ
jgi:sirohydrochlorin cobaltochelatase